MLPDILEDNLDVVFVGTAAGLVSAQAGIYYANKQNKFWPTLEAIGLIPEGFDRAEFRAGAGIRHRLHRSVQDAGRHGPHAGARRFRYRGTGEEVAQGDATGRGLHQQEGREHIPELPLDGAGTGCSARLRGGFPAGVRLAVALRCGDGALGYRAMAETGALVETQSSCIACDVTRIRAARRRSVLKGLRI